MITRMHRCALGRGVREAKAGPGATTPAATTPAATALVVTALAALAVAGPAACVGPVDGRPGGALFEVPAEVHEGAVVGGTRLPTVVPMDADELRAIGWLHRPGEAHKPFCTGSVVGARAVLTAAHCVGPLAQFSVGAEPSAPLATVDVAQTWTHPRLDLAVLELASAPGLQAPIAPLGRGVPTPDLVGGFAEAGGFGQTRDPARQGLWFAALEVTQIRPTLIETHGRGVRGVCFGDSGGPLLVERSGRPRVIGVVRSGESSCVMQDTFTRLDAADEWLSGRLAEAAAWDPPTPAATCGELDFAGRCDGDVLSWCDEAGRPARHDCAADGQRCAWGGFGVGRFCEDP